MKRLLLMGLICAANAGMAQDYFFRADATIGSAMTFQKMSTYGISAGVEPKFFFNENISVGLRLEGNVLFGGKISGEADEISVGMSSRTAYLLKGEYYLGSGNVKPFFGLMGGYYTQANIGAGGNGNATVSASRNFGGAPEIGITFGNFRISALYHFVGGQDIVSIGVGEQINVPHNYCVIQLGFRTYGIGDE